jgi:hypothetical protein
MDEVLTVNSNTVDGIEWSTVVVNKSKSVHDGNDNSKSCLIIQKPENIWCTV